MLSQPGMPARGAADRETTASQAVHIGGAGDGLGFVRFTAAVPVENATAAVRTGAAIPIDNANEALMMGCNPC